MFLVKQILGGRGRDRNHYLYIQTDKRPEESPPMPGGCGSKPMGSRSGVGEFTTHFRLPILVGLGPVSWGLTDLAASAAPRVV